MSITIDSVAYSLDAQTSPTSVRYASPANTVSAKDLVQLARTAPKPSAAFSGVARASAKFTRTVDLTGAITPKGDIICEVSFSVPVGAADADVVELCDDVGEFVASASCEALAKAGKINQ